MKICGRAAITFSKARSLSLKSGTSTSITIFGFTVDDMAVNDPGQLRYFGGESLVTKSHGQSLMAYFRARYECRGLYLLDEPETALSPASQVELVRLVHRNSGDGHAQFGLGSFILADGMFVILEGATGMLRLLEASTTGYKELASAQILGGHDVWSPLALSDGKLVMRDFGRMVCVRLK